MAALHRVVACSLTTGNATFAVCPKLCRVLYIGHTTKVVFAVCCRFDAWQNKGTRQTNCLPCAFDYNTRQTEAARQIDYFAVYLLMKPTVNSKHTANVLKSVTGKCFAVCPAGTLGKQHLLPCVFQFCRESRPMHTAKYWSKS